MEEIPGQARNDGNSVMAGSDWPSLARKGCREGWQGMTVAVGAENELRGSWGVSVGPGAGPLLTKNAKQYE